MTGGTGEIKHKSTGEQVRSRINSEKGKRKTEEEKRRKKEKEKKLNKRRKKKRKRKTKEEKREEEKSSPSICRVDLSSDFCNKTRGGKKRVVQLTCGTGVTGS